MEQPASTVRNRGAWGQQVSLCPCNGACVLLLLPACARGAMWVYQGSTLCRLWYEVCARLWYLTSCYKVPCKQPAGLHALHYIAAAGRVLELIANRRRTGAGATGALLSGRLLGR